MLKIVRNRCFLGLNEHFITSISLIKHSSFLKERTSRGDSQILRNVQGRQQESHIGIFDFGRGEDSISHHPQYKTHWEALGRQLPNVVSFVRPYMMLAQLHQNSITWGQPNAHTKGIYTGTALGKGETRQDCPDSRPPRVAFICIRWAHLWDTRFTTIHLPCIIRTTIHIV